jgi:hypothetical protein
MKRIINIYGENHQMVNTVASRLNALTTIPFIESVHETKYYGIMTSTTKNLFSGCMCYNHCVDTNDMVDDDYVLEIWMKADNVFSNPT